LDLSKTIDQHFPALGSNCALKASTFINILVLSQYEGDKRIKFGWLMRGLIAFGFHLIGETVFWLKSLYQLGFVRFFGFYFWIKLDTTNELLTSRIGLITLAHTIQVLDLSKTIDQHFRVCAFFWFLFLDWGTIHNPTFCQNKKIAVAISHFLKFQAQVTQKL
jgi:hypothetical protein